MRDSAFPRPPTSRGIPAESKPAKDKSGSGNRLQRNAARLSHERMMTRCHTHSCLVRARPRTRSRCSTPATPPSEVNALDFDGGLITSQSPKSEIPVEPQASAGAYRCIPTPSLEIRSPAGPPYRPAIFHGPLTSHITLGPEDVEDVVARLSQSVPPRRYSAFHDVALTSGRARSPNFAAPIPRYQPECC